MTSPAAPTAASAGPAGGGGVVATQVHRLVASALSTGGRCRVLDVGGGSGVWAVPLAVAGAQVTVVDASPDALASLARRAREAGVSDRVSGVQGDADLLGDVVGDTCADVVLAHGVLEVVEDVHGALVALASTLAPGGALSVVVAGRSAAVLHRALAGRLEDARHVLVDPDGRVGAGDVVLRRFDVAGLESALVGAGLVVQLVQGDGVVADLVPSALMETAPGSAATLAELERLASAAPPLRELASRLHAVATVVGGKPC